MEDQRKSNLDLETVDTEFDDDGRLKRQGISFLITTFHFLYQISFIFLYDNFGFWFLVFKRKLGDCKCTYNNSSDWVWSAFVGMGHGSAGFACWSYCSDPLLFDYFIHFKTTCQQLQVPRSNSWNKKLHLHAGCTEQSR